jgi:hypothetical protein
MEGSGMSLSGYECTCADRCTCFKNITVDPEFAARLERVSKVVERLDLAELKVAEEHLDDFAERLEALAGEFGL